MYLVFDRGQGEQGKTPTLTLQNLPPFAKGMEKLPLRVRAWQRSGSGKKPVDVKL